MIAGFFHHLELHFFQPDKLVLRICEMENEQNTANFYCFKKIG